MDPSGPTGASFPPESPSTILSSLSPSSDGHSGERHNSTASSSSRDRDRDRGERITVPSACVQCRSKHLKCDGSVPCSRCVSNTLECVYVRSRRGFKGPRKNGPQSKASPVMGDVDNTCPLIYPNGHPSHSTPSPNIPSGLATPPDFRLMALPQPVDLPLLDINITQDVVTYAPKAPPPALDLRGKCIEAFFYHFYAAHPFVPPRDHFYHLQKQKPIGFLEAAIRYVGSFYVAQAPTVALGLEAERALYSTDCPQNVFRVQGLLILALGHDGYTHQEKALQILLDAQDLALDLGLNKRDFALTHGGGSAVLEESWRRTWWELYIVDGMIAGVHQKSNFRMKDMVADVLLPCEEREFMSGDIPQSHSIEDFDDESFDGRDFTYSSYTYRIAAIRNLGRLLTAKAAMLPEETIIDKIDTHLVNWRLHLPNHKRDFINHEGQLDEMLFQGHMITEAERSELDSSVARGVTSCAPHKAITPGQSFNIHAAKTIQAAQDISKLIKLPVPLIKHTHFFTCVVTLASIVHLSVWSAMAPSIQDDDLKQQLRLNTGALKSLWQVWPSAGRAFSQVKGVAQEIYAAKKQAALVGFWPGVTEEELVRGMIEDQRVMEELQLLA